MVAQRQSVTASCNILSSDSPKEARNEQPDSNKQLDSIKSDSFRMCAATDEPRHRNTRMRIRVAMSTLVAFRRANSDGALLQPAKLLSSFKQAVFKQVIHFNSLGDSVLLQSCAFNEIINWKLESFGSFSQAQTYEKLDDRSWVTRQIADQFISSCCTHTEMSTV